MSFLKKESKQKHTHFLVSLFAVALLATYFLALQAEKNRAVSVFRANAQLWNEDLAVAVINADRPSIQRLGRSFFPSQLSAIQIMESNNIVFAFPTDSRSTNCSFKTFERVSRYGVDVGTIEGCFKWPALLQSAFFSPLFVVVSAIILTCSVVSAVVFLNGYRSSLINTMHILEEYLIRSKGSSYAKVPSAKPRDKLSGRLFELVESAIKERSAAVVSRRLGAQAAQVAHDIKSPLFALDVLSKRLGNDDPDLKALVVGAVSRIRDIVSNLSKTNDSGSILESDDSFFIQENVSVQRLDDLIAPILAEKKEQYRDFPGLKVRYNRTSVCLSGWVCRAEFQRVLSNLIDNSVEAIDKEGDIEIGYRPEGNRILVSVTDNGKGIPSAMLNSVTELGVSYGKPNGSGLGLYHAKRVIQAMGGTLKIESTIGVGTTVNLLLRPDRVGPFGELSR